MKRKTLAFLSGALTVSALAWGVGFMEREIAFSEVEIQAALAKSGPVEQRYGGLISASLKSAPKVTLGNPEGRVAVVARVDIAVLGNRPIPVDVAGTAGIRYDDNAKAFFLENPVAHVVESPYLPREYEPAARQAVNTLVVSYFRARPVYTLREDGSAQEAAARWLLRSVRIEPGRVVAILSPL